MWSPYLTFISGFMNYQISYMEHVAFFLVQQTAKLLYMSFFQNLNLEQWINNVDLYIHTWL